MGEADEDRNLAGAPATPGKVAVSDPLAAERTAAVEPAAASDVRTVDIQAYIGQQLRAVYEDVAKQPVPDRFLELMRQLDTK